MLAGSEAGLQKDMEGLNTTALKYDNEDKNLILKRQR